MSYTSYRSRSASSRGRGFSTRGSFRGRGGADASSSSWNTAPRGGRGGFSGPSRGRFNWYKEHSSSAFDSRSRYGGPGGGGAGASGMDRYSARGRADESYRRSYRADMSEYSRDHSHHRSPESQRKRMRTEHSYVQASSGRRSHEGAYVAGTDYNNRYGYPEDKGGYGEDRSRGYREDRRPSGGFRDRSREEYPHRKVDQLDSVMPPPGGPPRHMASPRGTYRGRISSRGVRGLSRMTLTRRADAILARKRSIMESYAVRKRITASRAQVESLRRPKIPKLRRLREAGKKEAKGEKDGSAKDEMSEEEEDNDEDEDEEEKEENWDDEEKAEEADLEEGEAAEKAEKPVKKVKKEKKTAKEEEREEGEEVDEEDEAEDEDEDEEEEKEASPKKSDIKNGGVHITIKQDSDTRAVSEEVKRTTFHGKPFIRLTCPHCFMRCITFKEYSIHLYSSKHINAMRKQSLRLKQTLARMRMTQRQKQRIVEENESLHGTLSSRTKFCPICKLNYRQLKTKHQTSDYHRAMKKFLMPYCRVCHIGFKSPMLYENHICSLDHIKREERMKETFKMRERAREEHGSGMEEEERELSLENFMTLDSVGTVDDEGEEGASEGEGKGKTDKEKKDGEEKKRTEINLGSEYIKKVEVYFCDLCRTYLPRLDQPERALSIHCRSRPHLQRYVRHQEDLVLRCEAEHLHHRAEAKEAAEKEKAAEVKKEPSDDKMADSTTEKEVAKGAEGVGEVKEKTAGAAGKDSVPAGEKGASGAAATAGTATGKGTDPAEDLDHELEAGMDEKLWADMDKDLGDLLREVEPGNKSSDEDEDSRAEGGRYDRFRYSEKGSTGAGDAPDTTKAAAAAADGEPEAAASAGTAADPKEKPEAKPKLKAKAKGDDDGPPAKKAAPSAGAAAVAPAAAATN